MYIHERILVDVAVIIYLFQIGVLQVCAVCARLYDSYLAH